MTKAGLVSDLHPDTGSIWRSGRKLVLHGAVKGAHLFSQLPLQNRYESLGVVDEGCEEV